ncbi:MAG: hypothetical protein Q9174_002949 [Haloplaca sp. 1 TL-2023]
MSSRPPSSTHPDRRSDPPASAPFHGRGVTHELLPTDALSRGLSTTAPISRTSALPPPVPVQPTYITPSSSLDTRYDSISRRAHSPPRSQGCIPRSVWDLPASERPRPMPLPKPTGSGTASFGTYTSLQSRDRSGMMSPAALPLRGSQPPWLLPNPDAGPVRHDPFTHRKPGTYGVTSSPAAYASAQLSTSNNTTTFAGGYHSAPATAVAPPHLPPQHEDR